MKEPSSLNENDLGGATDHLKAALKGLASYLAENDCLEYRKGFVYGITTWFDLMGRAEEGELHREYLDREIERIREEKNAP